MTTKDSENQPDSKPMLLKDHKKYELVDETTCGIGIISGEFVQKFANQKFYVFLYGLTGLTLSAVYSYFNGIITTIEKRYQIPSHITGVITVGNDIGTLLVGAIVTYYAGKGHRPRWLALGLYTVVLFCALNALPHFLYGPGEDALALTMEYGGSSNSSDESTDNLRKQTLCGTRQEQSPITTGKDSGMAAIILFISQFISGTGGCLYFTIGVAYMDDNSKKSAAPALVSFSYFIRMLGPAIGYSMSSLFLKMYIAPSLTPKITNSDPRWLGAWWIGWLILAVVLFVVSSLLGLFPRTLPKTRYRRQISEMSNKTTAEPPASVKDMMATFKRLVQNKVLMCSTLASMFFFFGYMPYWIFMPKYIETIYKTTASEASLVTGAIGLVFSAVGILVGGAVITKYKPSARSLAMWNMIAATVSGFGILSYSLLGCPYTKDPRGHISNGTVNYITDCNANCSCEYVKYTPVCAYGESYISPCHAGCRNVVSYPNGTKLFTDCDCVKVQSPDGITLPPIATSGPCAADCTKYFYTFLSVLCFLKFVGATARTSNFLISVRCVDEVDKPASMGFGATLLSLFSFIPSPIFFGYLIDTTCLVWGKTYTGKGNCWLYDADTLKYVLNITASSFVFVGLLFDIAVWYYVKDVHIFDVDPDPTTADATMDKELEVLSNGKSRRLSEAKTKEDGIVESY